MQPKEKEQKGEEVKGSNRLAHLREIELSRQKLWKENHVFEADAEEDWQSKYDFETKNKKKYLITFPYPYMNGRLHLGHGFSLSKAEFQSRYQRLQGKNVLFPFGFHCTGMPIAAAAKRVAKEFKEDPDIIKHSKEKIEKKKEEKKKEENKKEGDKKGKKNEKKDEKKPASAPMTQTEILLELGVADEDLHKFSDPEFWLEYFPPYGKSDLEKFGINVDFRRSFITTEKQKYYDKFVQWQMLKLKQHDMVAFGKRNAIFSMSEDQACADHDRSCGEGLGPQEYTLIKMKLLDGDKVPEKIKKILSENKTIFLVAATLRPETMYGQTNCYILPKGEYGLYEMANGEIYITSEHAILNMAYQEKTKIPKKAEPILKIKGEELIGVKILAPLSTYKEVYLFPMETISMSKGTGIVTSVPSDSPDDYINLLNFKNDEKLRKKWGITPEMIFDPVHIISLEGFSGLAAKDVVEKLGIKSPKEKEKLQKAKEEVYTQGFYKGIIDIGPYKGQPIKDVKDKVKADLIQSGEADTYFEPEGLVKNRIGEECVVALVDQWYIKYGEEDYKNFLLNYIKTDKFNPYSSSTLKGFEQVLGWLSSWGLSRTFGLGSHIPWDKKYLIESLSDSTIYMAYYTIANFLHEDIYGLKPNNGILPEMLTEEVFDYIFLGKELDFSKTQIPEKVLKDMRNSFTYWYPMDLRCSGKDLIGNHLTMSLYNHAIVWDKNPDYMTRGYFCNGYILVDGEKMSKSKGNFLTINDLIENYGCDASRITLADCGDTLDDANFLREISNLSVNRLYSFENFVKILVNEVWNKIPDFKISDPDSEIKFDNLFDQIFDNNINYLIKQATQAYEEMKYKNVLKYAFYEMINAKDQYILFNADDYTKLNPTLMVRFLKVFFIMNNPIMPHFSEYMFVTYLNPIFDKSGLSNKKIEFLCKARFPVASSEVDTKLFEYNKYMNKVIQGIRDTASKKIKKGKKDKKEEKAEEKKDVKVKILFAKEYTPMQKEVLGFLRKQTYDENNKIISLDEKGAPLYKNEILSDEKIDKNSKKNMLEFAAFKAKEIENFGKEVLNENLQFNEEEVLNNNVELFKKLTGVKEIEITLFDEKNKPKGIKDTAMPGKPIYIQE
jgi:leucyl-tRNA synthetase